MAYTKTLRQNTAAGFSTANAPLTNDQMDQTLISLNTDILTKLPLSAGNTAGLTGQLFLNPSSAGSATLNFGSGATVSSPSNGDMYTNTNTMYYYYGGIQYQFLYTNGTFTGTVTNAATINTLDGNLTVSNSTDNTKKFNFSNAGQSTGTTITITLPSLSSTLATLVGTENIANKTISASTVDGSPIGSTTPSTGIFTTVSAPTYASPSTTVTMFGATVTTLNFGAVTTAMNIGGVTAGSTTNIQTGAVSSGNTKNVNIGTGGVAGSTTTVTIGANAGTSVVNLQGTLQVNGAALQQNGVSNVPSVLSGATTLASGGNYECNTTAAAFSVTLPATPSAGAILKITDYAGTFGTNNLTILRNSSNIMASATDMVVNVGYQSFYLVYVDSTKGWSIQS